LAERDTRRLVSHSPQLLTPEIEYPIPPPSPNKVNRSRIKAVPRFGQRNTSFSASESEDESRRNHRHRNDSVRSETIYRTNPLTYIFSRFALRLPDCRIPTLYPNVRPRRSRKSSIPSFRGSAEGPNSRANWPKPGEIFI
jgi:hypothetical protein